MGRSIVTGKKNNIANKDCYLQGILCMTFLRDMN